MPVARGKKPGGCDPAYEAMLLSHVNDGVVGADADSRITYWGKGAERMYGFSQAEALGKTTLELLRPTYAPGERERIFESLDRSGTAVSTLRTKHKDGSEVIVEVNSTRCYRVLVTRCRDSVVRSSRIYPRPSGDATSS